MPQIDEIKKLSNANEKGLEELKTFQKETKKELFYKFEKFRIEINYFNNELNKTNNEKESWFRKKEGLFSNIRKKINSINENRRKRDSLTKKVKELKEKRRNSNEGIRKKISELITLKTEAKKLSTKSKVKDPLKIKGFIDNIEVKLETEAMPFEKETGLSKKLKVLKKSLNEASKLINATEKIRKLN